MEFERQPQQAEALANLATATAADRQAEEELSISNGTLTHKLRTATATITTLQQRLASCQCAPKPRQEKRAETMPAKIQAATLRHWIHMDISGRMVITSVGATMEHRVTIPCQDIRVHPPEQIRWEEEQNTIQNDIQGRN